MDTETAIVALAALAQPTRLGVFRALVTATPEGLPAGDVAGTLGVPQNTLSSHLSVLAHAGLVDGERRGRSIVYRANLERLRAVVGFLVTDCCGGRAELCTPLIADLMPCCPPTDRPANVDL